MPVTGFVAAAARVFDLALGQMLWSRRTIFMALVVGVPVVVAAVLRLGAGLIGPEAMESAPVSGATLFGLIVWALYVRFSVPVLAVFYGTSIIADEVEDKTLTYLFTRPIPRGAVVVGKYFAYLVCTICVVVPSVIVVWLLVVPLRGTLGQGFPDLLVDLALISAGLAVYGALFAWVGASLKRPLLFGLIYVFGWEAGTLAMPGYLKRISVAYYLEGLVPHALPADSPIALLQSLFRDPAPLATNLLALGVIGVACLALAARAAARREYVLDQ